ncbi:MAG TPA: hypothetical protein VFY27_08480, partial [Woeseiaceae bacterium]|nr:hypothetical protein [Woeseiaceae bacterium]
MNLNQPLLLLLPFVLAAIAGCEPPPDNAVDSEDMMISKAMDASIYSAAIASEERPEKDIERDERSKPAKVLQFFEIQPGMRVLDLFSGGGYYSELLSRVVGPEGSVVAHN